MSRRPPPRRGEPAAIPAERSGSGTAAPRRQQPSPRDARRRSSAQPPSPRDFLVRRRDSGGVSRAPPAPRHPPPPPLKGAPAPSRPQPQEQQQQEPREGRPPRSESEPSALSSASGGIGFDLNPMAARCVHIRRGDPGDSDHQREVLEAVRCSLDGADDDAGEESVGADEVDLHVDPTSDTLSDEGDDAAAGLPGVLSEGEVAHHEHMQRILRKTCSLTREARRERQEVVRLRVRYDAAVAAQREARQDRRLLRSLEEELGLLRREEAAKEERHAAAVAKLQRRCEQLALRNEELQAEVRRAQELRLAPAAAPDCSTPRSAASSDEDSDDAPRRSRGGSDSAEEDVVSEETPPPQRGSSAEGRRAGASPEGPQPQASLAAGASAPAAAADPAAVLLRERRAHRGAAPALAAARPRRIDAALYGLPADSDTDMLEDDEGDCLLKEIPHPDGRLERRFRSGRRTVCYSNGTSKATSLQGHQVLRFANGDVRRTYPSGRVVYYYQEADTTHTTYRCGLELFEFHSSGQVEKLHKDGTKEVFFADGTLKIVAEDGSERLVAWSTGGGD